MNKQIVPDLITHLTGICFPKNEWRAHDLEKLNIIAAYFM